ncbi:electron transfer flavoprotein subunit beta/FixA family protein [Tepidibacter hydrothermalis]|uniref:Electron transfer flavoprotein small subunit n=1 Tax=Tepidibacter hydrothermalis TaxID=3036126 RepID=A0ABY8EEK3_9FIRM|nr:electron transfer flavoprotein subunit beta/FixA family protein [Tepidibacter hydrothermalis]WFD10315.1 electron transfer flavoprotein subunit beta/FixA family protein [Tepidibacter hydrothermalis]
MKIVVCVKQVPDTNEVRINHETGTLIRDGVPSIINPDDKNALEEALRIKDKLDDVNVTVLTMGPPQAKESLNEALAMGADEAILLTDRAFAGSDTWATATILAAAVEKIGDYDIVFCGRQAIDGDTAQVGPEMAEFLDLPQITYVQDLEIKQEDKKVVAKRAIEDGQYIIESSMPVVLTAIKELNEPRYMSTWGIFQNVKNNPVKVMTLDDLEIDITQIGLKGSPTNVYKTFVPTNKFEGEILQGDTNREKAVQFMLKMKEKHII